MQGSGVALLACFQPGAQGGVARGKRGKAVQQRAQVETGTSYGDGDSSAGADFGNRASRQAGVVSSGVTAGEVQHVQQVMRNASPFGDRCLGGPDVESTVQLQGVEVDDFAVQPGGQRKSQRALAGAGRPNDSEQIAFRGGRGHSVYPSPHGCSSAPYPRLYTRDGGV